MTDENRLDGARLLRVLGDISDRYVTEAAEAMKKPKGRALSPLRLTAAAACLCLLAGGLWGVSRFRAGRTEQPTSVPDSSVPASQAQITLGPEGVTIPRTEFILSTEGQEIASMIPFFIYEGRSYVWYEELGGAEALIGDWLGTATGSIDVWTPRDGYVDLAGSVRGDFYSVQGFDPAFLLCIPREDGRLEAYINDNGITLKTGAELFEDRLHLSEQFTGLEYEAHDSWFYNRGEVQTLADDNAPVVRAFLAALDEAEFLPTRTSEGQPAWAPGNTLWHVCLPYASGMKVTLRISAEGYVSFDGIGGICLKPEAAPLGALTALFDMAD